MKKTTKTFSILMMAAMLAVSCGDKKNSSGSGDSPSSVNDYATGVINSTGSVFNTIEEVRTSFNSTSFASGLSAGQEIIHAGTMYQSGGYSNGDLDLGIIQLNFNFNFNMGGSVTDSMRVLRVNSTSTDSVNVTRATDAQYNPYTGQIDYDYTGGETSTMSRSSSDYTDMLLLDNPNCAYVQVLPVIITARTAAQQVYGQPYVQPQQLQLNGNQITCMTYYGSGSRSYIVSNALPVAANPIVASENGQLGYLVNVGNTYFTGYQVQQSSQYNQYP